LRYLSQRDYGVQELFGRLQAKGFSPSVIDAVLISLQSGGYLDEQRFAESYIRFRAAKGFGPERIRLELQQKEVLDERVQAAFATLDIDWVAAARRVKDKKYGQEVPADRLAHAKQWRFLQYRGFNADDIKRIYRQA